MTFDRPFRGPEAQMNWQFTKLRVIPLTTSDGFPTPYKMKSARGPALAGGMVWVGDQGCTRRKLMLLVLQM
jgi:hypothetical protein